MPARTAILAHGREDVIACVALFAALGGTSYATVSVRPGTVTPAAVAGRAVSHAKLPRAGVTSMNVAQRPRLTVPARLRRASPRGPENGGNLAVDNVKFDVIGAR